MSAVLLRNHYFGHFAEHDVACVEVIACPRLKYGLFAEMFGHIAAISANTLVLGPISPVRIKQEELGYGKGPLVALRLLSDDVFFLPSTAWAEPIIRNRSPEVGVRNQGDVVDFEGAW